MQLFFIIHTNQMNFYITTDAGGNWVRNLTYWGLDKKATILQTTLSYEFS